MANCEHKLHCALGARLSKFLDRRFISVFTLGPRVAHTKTPTARSVGTRLSVVEQRDDPGYAGNPRRKRAGCFVLESRK